MAKDSQEKTCKECKYYEAYDGPELTPMGNVPVMKCNNPAFGYTYSDNIRRCYNFTPKSIIDRLKDRNYVKKFGKMTPEQQAIYVQIGKENCLYRYFGQWLQAPTDKSFCSRSRYVIKPDYTPKEPENTCKECKYYEPYSGKEHPNATWHCTNAKVIETSIFNAYYSDVVNKTPCSNFTPKKPKEPEKTCKDCKYYRPLNEPPYVMQCTSADRLKYTNGKYMEIAGTCSHFTPKSIIDRLKDRNYVKKFGEMTPEEQDVYRQVGKENCLYRYFEQWLQAPTDKSFCSRSRYVIKPDYTPKEPEKKCSNCGLSEKHNGLDVNCRDHPDKPKGSCMPNRIHWQPIPAEKPKEPVKAEKPKELDYQPTPEEPEKKPQHTVIYNGKETFFKCDGHVVYTIAGDGNIAGPCPRCGHAFHTHGSHKPKQPKEPVKANQQKLALQAQRERYEGMRAQRQAPSSLLSYLSGSVFGRTPTGPYSDSIFSGPISSEYGVKVKKPQIKKEKTMLKKVKHLYRMAGTAWLVYGHVLVITFLYPWLLTGLKWANAGLFRLARFIPATFIPFPDVERVVDGETIMVPLALDAGDVEHIAGVWFLALVAVAVVAASIYGLHRFSNFFWGRNHE